MTDFLSVLFETSGFPARWYCGDWTPLHGWTHVLADLAIFGAYAAIPLSIAYYLRLRRDVHVPGLGWLFAAFIFSCGFAHLIEATLFWHPWYRFSGLLKIITALISWVTVIAIYRSLPMLMRLPGLAELNETLRRSEENLAVTLDSIGDGVLVTDARGCLTRLNPVAEALTGWPEAEALGRPIAEIFRLVHGETRLPVEVPVDKVFATGGTVDETGHSVLVSRDGREFAVDDRAAPIRGGDGTILGAVLVFRDVTAERAQAEAERRRMQQSFEFQSGVLEMRKRDGAERSEFLGFLTERVAEAIQVERVSVWLFDSARGGISCEDLYLRSAARHERGAFQAFADGPTYFRAISNGEVVAVEDAPAHPLTRELAGKHLQPLGITAKLDHPIREAGRVVGVICCEHTGGHRAWTSQEEEFLSSAAGTIEVSLENGKRREAEAEVRRLNQNLEGMVAERTAELRDQKELMARLLENLTDGVVACDAKGQLSFFNRVAREWHGGDIDDAGIENWANRFDLLAGDGVRPLAAEEIPLVRALHGEQVRGAEMAIGGPGGSPRLILASGDAIYGESGDKLGAVVVMHDVTERRRAEGALRLAAERVQLAAKAGRIGIWDLDVPARVLAWNEQMHAIYGVTADVVPSVDLWLATLHPKDRDRAGREFERALAGDPGGFDTEFRLVRHSDGSTRFIRALATVFRFADGRASRVIGTNWDITDERAREHALAEALETQRGLTRAAEAGERAKGEFLAVMSHEIRTPLNGILGFAEILRQSTALSPEDRGAVDTISGSGETLLRILDDVLDFSSLEAGPLKTTTAPFSPAQLLVEMRDFFGPAAGVKALTFAVVAHPDLPAQILGDAGRTRQILLNLLGNACKFTEHGGITLEARYTAAASSGGDGQIEFLVRDTGRGLSREELAQVFQAFYQADRRLAREYGGTGLGLAISRRLAVAMGGSLTGESPAGEGVTFFLRLPASPAPPGPSLPPTARPTAFDAYLARRRPLRILIVEDDRVNLRLIVNIMRKLGYEPATALDGLEALESFVEGGADLIFMDLQMPRVDGIEATRRIRAWEQQAAPSDRRVFISALTANVVVEDRKRCLDEGMDAVLNKPLRITELKAVLEIAHARLLAS